MIQKINRYDFRRAFVDYNRAFNFSYEALDALFEYFEQYEEESGRQIELDVIAICCEYSEYADLAEVQANYTSTELDTIDELRDHTSVIEFDGGLIIADF